MTNKIGTVDLPPDELNDARDNIWASVTTGDSKSDMAAYQSLLAAISHPTAVFRLRAVRGTRRKQLLLNTLVLWRRLGLGLYVGLIILGFISNKLFLLGIPLVLLVNLVLLNPLQTRINVDLSARLIVLDRLMDEDDGFRRRVLGE